MLALLAQRRGAKPLPCRLHESKKTQQEASPQKGRWASLETSTLPSSPRTVPTESRRESISNARLEWTPKAIPSAT